MSRDDVLSRYRAYRSISVEIQTAALKHVPRSAVLKQAKRLGLSDGKVLTVGREDDVNFVFDLILYTARSGRSRGIDRYAHVHQAEPGSDQQRVLSALQAARFSLFQIKERHGAAGLILEDLLREEEVWLVDEGLEASAADGMVLGMRVAVPDAFAITCGVMVPIDVETLREIARVIDNGDTNSADLADDPRFAESIYELGLELQLTEMISYR